MSDYYNATVSIVKSDTRVHWYADKIGEIFDVYARTDGKGGYLFREGDDLYQIAKDDAIELVRYDGKDAGPEDDRDLIIALSRTVADLTTRLEEAEDKIEMLTDDVVMLDERTQPPENIPAVYPKTSRDVYTELFGYVKREGR